MAISLEFVKNKVATGKPYTILFLNVGPAYTTMPADEVQKVHMAHLMHLFELKEQGHLLLVGPVNDNPVIKGIAIFKSTDKEEVKAFMANDPAVKAGRFVFEVFGWFGIPGDGI